MTRGVARGVAGAVVTADAAADDSPKPLEGKSVCVTGSMAQRTRTEMAELIVSLGGRAASSVSASTTILVAGPGAGSKADTARRLNVQVMTEDEFLTEFAS